MVKHYLGIGVLGLLAVIAACSSDSDSPTADCKSLTTCCPQLKDDSNKTACESLVKKGVTDDCSTAQSTFVDAMLCTVSESGSGSSSSAPKTGCAGLSACCSSLGADEQPGCQDEVTAAEGSDTVCTSYLEIYTDAGMCNVGGGSGTGSGATLSGCSGLSTCCSSLPSADQAECKEEATIAGGNATACSNYLGIYTAAGMCGGFHETATISTAGGSGCAGLKSCCESLSSTEQPSCDEDVTASNGNDDSCTTYLEVFTTEGMCVVHGGSGSGSSTTSAGKGGSDCSALTACCASLPSVDQAGCEEDLTLAAGSNASCASYLEVYTSAGMCGGQGSGSGSSGGGGCSDLKTCCSSLPSTEQTGCLDIVNEGNSDTCSEDLTSYRDAKLCN